MVALRSVPGRVAYRPVPAFVGTVASEVPSHAPRAAAGLAAGAKVDTADGPRTAGELRPGDLVLTRDRGYRPVRWVGLARGAANVPRIDWSLVEGAAAEGAGGLDPEALVVVSGRDVLAFSGRYEMLVRAADVAAAAGAQLTVRDGAAVQIAFDQDEIIRADGVWIFVQAAKPEGFAAPAGRGGSPTAGRAVLSTQDVALLVVARSASRAAA